MKPLQKWGRFLVRTPVHPQWLLGRRRVPEGLTGASGLILDIGAADRWMEQHLSSAAHYVALDYPATGRELYQAHPDVFADALHMPFREGSFDRAICLEVLEHVPDPAGVMLEIARVLKPGGRAWISMPFLYPLHDAPFDFQRFTEYGLRRDATHAGLKVLTLRKSGHAIRTAGLLLCLAIAGGVHGQRRRIGMLLLPFMVVAVFMVNMAAWLCSLVWPDWSHIGMGYELEVGKG